MEAEGAKRVFERSIKKHKLRQVAFLEDGDTKSYVNVKLIQVLKLKKQGEFDIIKKELEHD